jgi:outer membrane protein
MLLLGLAALAFSVLACLSADAAERVGIVDPQKLVFQHPQFDSVAKHIMNVTRQRENEIRFALEKETDPEKRAGILRTANQEMAEIEERLMTPLHKDCEHALTAVMKGKKITVVLKNNAVYFGGADITEDVIARLKADFKKQ